MTLTPLADLVESVSTWNPVRTHSEDKFDYIDLSAVDQETKSIIAAKNIRCADAPSRARQLIQDGDVLVSTVRPNLNGVAMVRGRFDGATASTGFCVLRPRRKTLHGPYLFHWVKSPDFVAEMVRRATGASYPAVSDRIVLDSQIPLPSLTEQRRIAAILDQADALRAKRREALAQLDRLTQAIFIDMFGDPVRNQKQWPNAAVLGDVADIVSGVTKGRRLNVIEVRPVPYLAVANVQDKSLNLSIVKEIEATEDEIRRYRLQKNDLLLTEGGDPDKLGRGTLWQNELPECIHQNHIFRVRLKSDQVHPVFLNWLVGSERGKKYFLRSAKQTTGIASINMTQLRGFPLLVPPMPLQLEFASRLEDLASIRSRQTNALEEMDCLFASLQHRAFRGEL